jgi:hypothetical protein
LQNPDLQQFLPRNKPRESLINLTPISDSLGFFSFSCRNLRKINIKVALIYSRLNKSVLPYVIPSGGGAGAAKKHLEEPGSEAGLYTRF